MHTVPDGSMHAFGVDQASSYAFSLYSVLAIAKALLFRRLVVMHKIPEVYGLVVKVAGRYAHGPRSVIAIATTSSLK